MALHNEIGKLGEDIAEKYLQTSGMHILQRNYLKKWGEIDIVTRETSGKIHFVEVKSVSYGTREELEEAISRGTFRPEENVHRNKQERLKRAMQTWLLENRCNGEWQIDVLAIHLVPREKYARVVVIENVIFE